MNHLLKVDKCYALVLDNRLQDFRLNILPQLKEYDINPELFIAGNGDASNVIYNHIDTLDKPPIYINSNNYTTWLNTSGAYNCFLCHQKIFRKALNAGAKTLMLLEDDIFIEEDFNDILNKCNIFFNENEWDAIYLGAYHLNTSDFITDNILKLRGSGGFHAIILKNTIVKELLSYAPIGQMDWIMGKYLHNKYKCYAIYPSIISQKSGYSFIESCELNKPSRFKL